LANGDFGNSIFVVLNDFLLLEYTYADFNNPFTVQAEIGQVDSPGNFYIFQNGYFDNTNFVSNTPLTPRTNNVPEQMVLPINTNRWVLNSNKTSIPFWESDSNINPEFPALTLNNPINVVYDRVRIHLASGWNFTDVQGIIPYVQVFENSQNYLTLASLVHEDTDDWFTYNSDSFLYNETLFDRYLEFLVPSTRELINDYQSAPKNVKPDTLAAKLSSDGRGLKVGNPIYIGVFLVERSFQQDGFTYYATSEQFETAVNQQDQFGDLFAEIRESENGDYFEYEMRQGGNSIENFIFSQNALPENDYVILHTLRVLEQVGAQEIETYNFSNIQNSSFDSPNFFRPILKYAENSPAFSIEYQATLFNQLGGNSMNRKADITCTTPNKYGQQLLRIPLTPVTPQKVYNRVTEGKNITISDETTRPTTVRYFPSFIEKQKIVTQNKSLSVNSQGEIVEEGTDDTEILYGQGKALIYMSPFDNYLGFTLYTKKSDGSVTPINLSFNSEYYLVFVDNSDSNVYIKAKENQDFAREEGELYFVVSKENSQRIVNFNNREFYIVVMNEESGLESNIYSGKFTNSLEDIEARDESENVSGGQTQSSTQNQQSGQNNQQGNQSSNNQSSSQTQTNSNQGDSVSVDTAINNLNKKSATVQLSEQEKKNYDKLSQNQIPNVSISETSENELSVKGMIKQQNKRKASNNQNQN
jgi:hypothetical protein